MFTAEVLADGSSSAELSGGLRDLFDAVNALHGNASDAVLIDQIGALERLKSACAAAQARLTHTFDLSQTAEGAARKRNTDTTRRSIAAQIALTRRQSRFAGQRLVGLAAALITDLPHILAALQCGDLTEHRARVILDQFACLTPTDRRAADTLLAAELPGLGDLTAHTRAARIACRLDAEAVLGKIRGAVKDRHISLRPAPDTMTRFSALLPVAQGVAVYAALRRSADTAVGVGDGRTRGQVMADELVFRVTGQTITGCDSYGAPIYGSTPAKGDPGIGGTSSRDDDRSSEADSRATGEGPVDCNGADNSGANGSGGLQLNIIMTDRTLLGDDDEPALITGHGPVPAALARALVIGNADTTTKTWIRRLYTDPTGTQLAAMDSKQRLFPAVAQKFLLLRDQTCRTPWCDAPIRHADHITPHNEGGPTSTTNGQGLCQACNLTKQAPDWRSEPQPDGTVRTTTPTGHTYASSPPTPPRSTPWQRKWPFQPALEARPDISYVELRLRRELFYAA